MLHNFDYNINFLIPFKTMYTMYIEFTWYIWLTLVEKKTYAWKDIIFSKMLKIDQYLKPLGLNPDFKNFILTLILSKRLK